ncbi:carotenoid biosynthesis protein [Halobacillus litoralis]|uniref:carotenoid biosynthesis protein n=1 Tax=Halobacillus litoralis TaxID=45668 RepID=UPI001CD3AB23|nr:carotenoid biosynthesis protein [Halobacillus litoralis]MCA0969475.1 carotenoid biosynthesis protein [Halobacillus litoralis]
MDIIYRFFIFWYICGVVLLSFDLIPPWLEWANSVFLITAGVVSALYFISIYGKRFGVLYSLWIIIGSIWVEHLGVEYDFLFGSYDYTSNFGIKIFDTPITIGFAWLLIVGCSHELARTITRGGTSFISKVSFVILGGLAAVTMDLILDPVSFKVKEYWLWQEPGLYYDIPFSNFIGWMVVASVFHLTYVLLMPDKKNGTLKWENRMALMFGLIIGMFCVVALTGGLFFGVVLVTILTIIWYAAYFARRRSYEES